VADWLSCCIPADHVLVPLFAILIFEPAEGSSAFSIRAREPRPARRRAQPAIAVANVHGPAAGIQAVEAIRDRSKLESYYMLYASARRFRV